MLRGDEFDFYVGRVLSQSASGSASLEQDAPPGLTRPPVAWHYATPKPL